MNLSSYCDEEWGADLVDRRSTTSFCVYPGSNLITWGAKKQSVISRSTTEAEFRSLANTVEEIIWLLSLLIELNVKMSNPRYIFCDNQSAIVVSANQVLYSKTKHLELNLFFLCEKVQQGAIYISHVSGSDQIADIFTKATVQEKFEQNRSKLRVVTMPSQSFEGGCKGYCIALSSLHLVKDVSLTVSS